MMHHEAGVKTIVVGGQPDLLGPMQAVAGTRGARDYESDLLDLDMFGAVSLNSSVASQLPDRDIDFNLDTASFNLQDQIRKGENFPLQFAYEAAECRIYYTTSTFYNMTALWHHAARATWTDPSLCVKYSTNHPSSTSKATDATGPSPVQRSAWTFPPLSSSAPSNNISIPLAYLADNEQPEIETDIWGREGAICDPWQPNICNELTCVQAPWCSPKGIFKPSQYQCVRLSKDGCPRGQVTGKGKCKNNPDRNGDCLYCKSKTPVTSQTCGTSTTKDVPDDRLSQPWAGTIRRGRGRKL